MKFDSTTGLSVESIPQETLYKITRGESYWVLKLNEAIALASRLQAAIDYEAEHVV